MKILKLLRLFLHVKKLLELDQDFLRNHVKGNKKQLNTLGEIDKAIVHGEEPNESSLVGMESIVMHHGRPVFFVKDNHIPDIEDTLWQERLAEYQDSISQNIKCTGRIEVNGHPRQAFLDYGEEYYAGSCVAVSDSLLLTNRHVALEFCNIDGTIKPGMTVQVDFNEELDRDPDVEIPIEKAVYIDPILNYAILRTHNSEPLIYSPFAQKMDEQSGIDKDRLSYIIGYPAFDTRNPTDVQHRIFQGKYNVKRLAPGRLRNIIPASAGAPSTPENAPPAQPSLVMDYTSLGGNSGSPVFDLQTGTLVGLHYMGRYGEANFAIPLPLIAETLTHYITFKNTDTNEQSNNPLHTTAEIKTYLLNLQLNDAIALVEQYDATNGEEPPINLICSLLVLCFFSYEHIGYNVALKIAEAQPQNYQRLLQAKQIMDQGYLSIWQAWNQKHYYQRPVPPPSPDLSIAETLTKAEHTALLSTNGPIEITADIISKTFLL